MPRLSQAEASQHMYGARAERYEDSWHPHYSSRFVRIVNPQAGQRILDLCCGTGLDLFLLADALNNSSNDNNKNNADDGGLVVGVDTTAEMLAVAAQRLASRPELAHRIQLARHDVTHLETLGTTGGSSSSAPAPLADQSFDYVVCSSAFVLFDDPDAVVAGWRRYLAAGGALVVDIPHEAAQRAGLSIERAARRLGLAFPSNRSWVRSVGSFRHVLERNGYRVERVVELDRVSGRGDTHYTAQHVDGLYDAMSQTPAFAVMAAGAAAGVERAAVVESCRPLFREEVMRDADAEGRVFESDSIYVYVARLTAGVE